jgi:hypothetical protein
VSGPWFAVHAGFVDGPRERALYDRWGWCGVVLWLAFTAACKRSDIEGQVAYHSDEQLAALLGIHGRELVDRDGKPFTLREFFQWTGIRRWTLFRRRTWPAVVYRGWEAHQRFRVYPRRAQPSRTPSEPLSNPAQKPSSEGESVDVTLTNDVPDTGGTTPGGTSTHRGGRRAPSRGARRRPPSPAAARRELADRCESEADAAAVMRLDDGEVMARWQSSADAPSA